MKGGVVCLVLCFAVAVYAQTTLNYYVQFDDYYFSWEQSSVITTHNNYNVYNLLMRSLKWLTTDEVDKSEWYHWVQVCIPNDYDRTADMAFMYITGGSNPLDINSPPSDIDEVVSLVSVNTGTIGVALHQIPNQPIYFAGDPDRGRSEDAMIAYTWSHWINNTFEYDWVAQYPMTKASLKAIDAVQEWILSQPDLTPVNRFVVGGGSKRGWTTWLLGGMGDPRVVGIVPIVAPIANLIPQINEMWQSYGGWSFALNDYVEMNLMGWLNLPRFTDLLSMIDPLVYNAALSKIPKYVVVASGDEFFMPDSAQYYWPQLSDPKFLRVVPNAEHSLAGHIINVLGGVEQFYLAILNNQNSLLPSYEWEISADGTTVTLTTLNVENIVSAKAWYSRNNTARDWRLLTCPEIRCANPVFFGSEDLIAISPGVYSYTLELPPEGMYSAFFVEVNYDFGYEMRERKQMQITSDLSIIPKGYPYPPCPTDVCSCAYDCATNYYTP